MRSRWCRGWQMPDPLPAFVHLYRRPIPAWPWNWRCDGAPDSDGCHLGWLGMGHTTERAARRAAALHVQILHASPPPPSSRS